MWVADFHSRRGNGSGKLFDQVAEADDAAFEDSAKHTAAAPEFFAQARPDPLHLIARRAHHRDFQHRFAHTKALPISRLFTFKPSVVMFSRKIPG